MLEYRKAILIVVVAAAMICCAGCKPNQPEREVVIAVDVSSSFASNNGLAKAKGPLASAIDAQDGQSEVSLYAFIKQPVKIAECMPLSSEDMGSAINEGICKQDWSKEERTCLAPTLEHILETASRSKLPVIALILTDGEFFDAQEAKAVVEQLATQKNFHYLFVGPVLTANRVEVETTFAKLNDCGKLQVFGRYDIQPAYDELEKVCSR